ncbi:nucleotidyltransferase family protein [Flavitalea sp. BT771]|uniref:nucleotidyltransferase family protein n=1 Tax=Flavitalea sp. BT771 TaxID=3063329 RepID=UPI0026E4195A|nr:nucleotidyltransferase family protein [Flavitalea sp. BT771]MDO6432495.1 nucleotidyltransferase family protein [Flavitalea sp. BT771]MDV6221404.1 nucleotidyltransferase family protein [Flavitalea sp. BT771]
MLTAIVLAAGSSRRMGKNKLLLPYRGRPLLAYVVENILSAKVGPVIVVTGHDAEQIEGALKGLHVQLVYNPGYDKGMTSSIQAGVTAAGGDGYMICLSDMALIRPEEYRLLKNAFEKEHKRDIACIIQPVYDNQTGNPVTFSAAWRQAILEHPGPEGCKSILHNHADNCYQVEMPTSSVLEDVDWPEDYDRLFESD